MTRAWRATLSHRNDTSRPSLGLGLQVRHMLGLSLQELSASQLDALRQLHERKMEALVEAALQAAREQGRLLAE